MTVAPDRQQDSRVNQHIVYALRQDGGEREFARYATADEARMVCERLIEVGCNARVGDADVAERGTP